MASPAAAAGVPSRRCAGETRGRIAEDGRCSRIERALSAALAHADEGGGPPRLGKAMQHAVFPRGARVRPRLCLAVSAACGEDDPAAADAAAAAIELLHCASLVHDDLPCFDDAEMRRGRPSVHRAFGVPLAVLAGDALIVLAFQTLARGAGASPRLGRLLEVVGAAVGAPLGIAAGQAWECEPPETVDLGDYQRSKTGILFAAAADGGRRCRGRGGRGLAPARARSSARPTKWRTTSATRRRSRRRWASRRGATSRSGGRAPPPPSAFPGRWRGWRRWPARRWPLFRTAAARRSSRG